MMNIIVCVQYSVKHKILYIPVLLSFALQIFNTFTLLGHTYTLFRIDYTIMFSRAYVHYITSAFAHIFIHMYPFVNLSESTWVYACVCVRVCAWECVCFLCMHNGILVKMYHKKMSIEWLSRKVLCWGMLETLIFEFKNYFLHFVLWCLFSAYFRLFRLFLFFVNIYAVYVLYLRG